MLKITFKNGTQATYDNYTDYKYDGKCFIVIKNEKWVGIYNIDHVISVVCCD